jgi:hypothetical protein
MAFDGEEQNTLRALKDLEELPNQSSLRRLLAQWWETYEK